MCFIAYCVRFLNFNSFIKQWAHFSYGLRGRFLPMQIRRNLSNIQLIMWNVILKGFRE